MGKQADVKNNLEKVCLSGLFSIHNKEAGVLTAVELGCLTAAGGDDPLTCGNTSWVMRSASGRTIDSIFDVVSGSNLPGNLFSQM